MTANPSSIRWKQAVLVAILALGLLIRAPTIVAGYYASIDPDIYVRWGRVIETRGLPNSYNGTDVDYPPLLLYLFGGAAWVESQLLHHRGAGNISKGGLAALLIRIPTALCDVGAAALLASIVWRRSRNAALLVAALYVFNPAIWYVSAIWGQTDSIYTLMLLASVLALVRRAIIPAWLFYALAIATKLQAISIVPLLAGWSLAKHGVRGLMGGLAAAGIVVGVLFAPWLLSGHAGDLLRVYTTPVEGRTVVSAYNLWYLLLGGNLRVPSASRVARLPFSYQDVGNALFVLLAVLIAVLALRSNSGPGLPAAALALSMFLVLTQMHERHAFPVLAFLAWAAAEQMVKRQSAVTDSTSAITDTTMEHAIADRGINIWWIYGILTLTISFNLVTILPFSPVLGTSIVVQDAGSIWWVGLKGLSLLAAGVNVAVLGWLLWAISSIRVWKGVC